jgi:hypothetical protein
MRYQVLAFYRDILLYYWLLLWFELPHIRNIICVNYVLLERIYSVEYKCKIPQLIEFRFHLQFKLRNNNQRFKKLTPNIQQN